MRDKFVIGVFVRFSGSVVVDYSGQHIRVTESYEDILDAIKGAGL